MELRNKTRLVDNIEGKSYIGSRITIKNLLYNLYDIYRNEGILKGVVFIKNTYYIN